MKLGKCNKQDREDIAKVEKNGVGGKRGKTKKGEEEKWFSELREN